MIFFILFILENCTFGFANYIFRKPIYSSLLLDIFYKPRRGLCDSRRGLYKP